MDVIEGNTLDEESLGMNAHGSLDDRIMPCLEAVCIDANFGGRGCPSRTNCALFFSMLRQEGELVKSVRLIWLDYHEANYP